MYINEKFNRDILVPKNELVKGLIFLCQDPDTTLTHQYVFRNADKEFGNSVFSTIWNIASDFKIKNPESTKITLQDLIIEGKKHEDVDRLFNENEVFQLLKVVTDTKLDTLSDNLTSTLEMIKKCSLVNNLRMNGVNVDKYLKTSKEGVYELIEKTSLDMIKQDAFISFEKIFEDYDTSVDVTTFDLKDIDLSQEENLEYGELFGVDAYNSFTSGMNEGTLLLRAGTSGASKTRNALVDALTISMDELWDFKSNSFKPIMKYAYDEETQKYIYKPRDPKPVLYMSTELNEVDVKYACLAFISGIPEQTIRKKMYKQGDDTHNRILRAESIINRNNFKMQFLPNVTIKILEQEVKKFKQFFGIKHFFYDYIHTTSALINEITKSMHNSQPLAEHQVLAKLSRALEHICHSHKVFLATSAQVSKNAVEYRGQQAIASSKSILHPMDQYIQLVEPTPEDIKQLKLIEGLDISRINLAHYISKNRQGQSDIYIWCNVDKNTMKTEVIACTNNIHATNPRLIEWNIISRFGDVKKITPQAYDKKEIERCVREVIGENHIYLDQARIAKGVNDIAIKMSARGLENVTMENVCTVYTEAQWTKLLNDANNLAKEKEKVPTFVEKPITSTLMKTSNEPEDDVDLELLFG